MGRVQMQLVVLTVCLGVGPGARCTHRWMDGDGTPPCCTAEHPEVQDMPPLQSPRQVHFHPHHQSNAASLSPFLQLKHLGTFSPVLQFKQRERVVERTNEGRDVVQGTGDP